jgi:hypothetical protein
VRRTLLVSGLAALAGDFTLTLRIHRRETAVLGTATLFVALVTRSHGALSSFALKTAASCGRPIPTLSAETDECSVGFILGMQDG